MKIPEKIEIAGLVYTIDYVESDSEKLEYGRFSGSQNPKSGLIHLDAKMNEQYTELVFLHEVVHACFDALNVSNSNITIDERFVESFCQIFYQALKQL